MMFSCVLEAVVVGDVCINEAGCSDVANSSCSPQSRCTCDPPTVNVSGKCQLGKYPRAIVKLRRKCHRYTNYWGH